MILVKSAVKLADKNVEKKVVSWLRKQKNDATTSRILPDTIKSFNFNLFQHIEDKVCSFAKLAARQPPYFLGFNNIVPWK